MSLPALTASQARRIRYLGESDSPPRPICLGGAKSVRPKGCFFYSCLSLTMEETTVFIGLASHFLVRLYVLVLLLSSLRIFFFFLPFLTLHSLSLLVPTLPLSFASKFNSLSLFSRFLLLFRSPKLFCLPPFLPLSPYPSVPFLVPSPPIILLVLLPFTFIPSS